MSGSSVYPKHFSHIVKRPHLWWAIWSAAGAVLLLLFYFWGAQTLDEGWYLNASHLARQGQRVYLDFNYTQGPVLPYLYGLLFDFIPYGLAGGRFIVLVFTILAWGMAVRLSWRLFGKNAALFTLMMLVAGIMAIGQYTYVATYALTSFFLLTGIYLWLASSWRWHYLAAALFLALAVGVRISTLPVLFLFFVAVLLDANVSRKVKALSIFVGIATLSAIFAPFVIPAPDLVWYNLIGYHTDRVTFAQRLEIWRYVGKLTLLLFSPFWLLGLLALRTKRSWWKRNLSPQSWILAVIMALFVVHFIPRTTAAYYHVLQYPLMTVLMGAWLDAIFKEITSRRNKIIIAAIISLAVISSQILALPHYRPLNFHYFPYQDLARWQRFFDEQVADSCKGEMVTFTPILAVESGMEPSPGLEMGIFSYRPTWETEKSLHYNSVNNPVLVNLLQNSDIVAFTDFTQDRLLYGDLSEINHTLATKYRLTKTFPHICPLSGDVNVYLASGCFVGGPEHPLQVKWENGLELQGISWDTGDEQSELALFWKAPAQAMTKDYTVFIHVLDEQGQLVFGYDERPCHDSCPTSSWQPHEVLRDEHRLDFSPPQQGNYRLEIGLYDEQVQRLPLAQGGDALILPLNEVLSP